MKNRIFCLVSLTFLLFLAAGIVAPVVTRAQEESLNERVARLEKEVAYLEMRLARLENSKPRVVPVSSSEQKSDKGQLAWRSLEKGMSKDQVKKLLGEPKDVMNFNENEIWDYASGGSIRFDGSGRVMGWYEP